MGRIVFLMFLALAATPLLAEEAGRAAPSMEEVWRVVQDQRTEIERLRAKVEELEAERTPRGFPRTEPISMRPMESGAPAVSEAAPEEGGAFRFGFLAGAASGQFGTGWGGSGAAFLDLTILRHDPFLSQRLSGEILLGYHSTTRDIDVTSALFGRMNDVTLESDTLTIFAGLKYTIEEMRGIKPYLVLGPALYVQGVKLRNGFVLGQVPQAPELDAIHAPDAWWEPEMGFQIGGGAHIDLSKALFLGVDGRYNFVGDANNDFGTISLDFGFRF